jgi:hypothetical protein
MIWKVKNINRTRIFIVCLILGLAVIACKFPFSIQTADVYLATAVQSTINAVLVQTQENASQLNATPISSQTQTPTPRYVGNEYKFVIHRVRNGENLSQYAQQFDTSEGAILRVNYSLNLPLLEGTMVVIPVGFTNIAQMPYFQPFMVTVGGLTVEDLARELATSLEDLKYYNGLFDGKQLNVGDWLIIPRKTPGY